MISSHSYSSLFSSESDVEEPMKLSIPLELLRQQMNVPMVAIRAIAQSEGIEIDSQGECISEDSLGVYADAYIRKLKEYFRRMTHNSELVLDPEDIIVFDQFCETFKKSTLHDSKVRSWSDIDQDAIRENFIQSVITKVPIPKKRSHDILLESLWSLQFHIEDVHRTESFGYSIFQALVGRIDCNLDDWQSSVDFREKCQVLAKVVHSSLYFQKNVTLPALHEQRRLKSVRLIPIVAHYYLYPNKDEDEMQFAA